MAKECSWWPSTRVRGFLKWYQAAVAGAEQEMLSQTIRCMCATQVTTKTPHTGLR